MEGEERKQQLRDQLEKARAKRKPAEYKNIHASVLALPDDHYLSYKSVKKWIKTQKELLTIARSDVRRKIKGAEAQVSSISGYIRHLELYLRSGTYIDMFWEAD